MKLQERAKKDFQLGQKFYYLESIRDRESGYNRKPLRLEVKILEVTKIGRVFVHFQNSRYQIGSENTEYFWGSREYRIDTSAKKVFDSEQDALFEVQKLSLIDKLSSDRVIQGYLQKLSYELLSLIESEISDVKTQFPDERFRKIAVDGFVE
jgi:major membrane immunogen (membrane-anchored lipoprotein)